MRKLKKVYLVLCIIIFITNMVCPILSKADTSEGTSKKYNNYLALGDSIAAGYGLDNTSDSYASRVKSNYEIDNDKFANKGIVGATCEEYYHIINDSEQSDTYKELIKNADLITISIGSNELLGLIVAAIADSADVSMVDDQGKVRPTLEIMDEVEEVFRNASAVEKAQMIQQISSFFTSEDTLNDINEKVQTYSIYWDKTVSLIKELNPNAVIVATEFYNPYYNVKLTEEYDIGTFTDNAIRQMNQVLEQRSKSETDYKIARIYEEFNTSNPRITNVNFNALQGKLNLDPHPNQKGHQTIATKIIKVADTVSGNVDAKKDISKLTIKDVSNYEYTGQAITPKVEISDNGTILNENVDYTITYQNNTDVGEASIIITGIGNYTGTITKKFKITPKDEPTNNNGNGNNSQGKENNVIPNANQSKTKLPKTGVGAFGGVLIIASLAVVIITRSELKNNFNKR